MQYQVSALAYVLVPLYGIDATQLSNLMFAPMLLSAVVGIPLGVMADRFGVRRVVGACLVLSVAGAVLRAMSGSYGVMVLASTIMGFAPAALNANVLKLLGAWFGERSSMALGVYYAASGLGASAAMLSTSLVSDVAVAFWLAAAALAVMAALWWAIVRGVPFRSKSVLVSDVGPAGDAELAGDFAREALRCLGVAARHRVVWCVALVTGLGLAAKTAYLGFLPQALAVSVDPQEAGLLASFVTYGGIVGCALGPLIGAKSGHVRMFAVACMLLSAALVFATSLLIQHPSPVLFFVAGALSSVTAPIVEAIPCTLADLRGCVGSAGGIIGSVSLAMSFFIPLGITVLAAGDYVAVIALTGVCLLAAVPILAYVLAETR